MKLSARPLASDATLAALEFGTLRRLLACEATTDLGRERILDLAPLADGERISVAFGRAREVERLLEDGALVPFFEEPLLPLLARLEADRGGLVGVELLPFGFLLRQAAAAAERIRAADPACPHLAELERQQPDLGPLEESLGRILDHRGRVREDASPRLAEATRRARKLRRDVHAQLERFTREQSDHLAEETIPLHDGRLVVLLRAGAKGRLAGLVHGRSGTGKSFYFEPLAAVEANNALQEALAEQEEERQRLLRELIEALYDARDELGARARFVAELDLRQAAARFAERCEGRLIEPTTAPDLALVEARHPLLEPRLAGLRQRALGQPGHTGEVVPLTLSLDSERRVLVVTGPNAGGKTVALKTVGLVVIAAHCGLPVPASAASRLPRLERVIATVGDEQDLLADRSTFSGRLLRLREAWEAAVPGSLVLLDELGSGTDPEEGAALAIALLEELVRGRALAVLTSHLTPLAAAALDAAGADCAAMEFDAASGEPTFELMPGPPGGSEAIALARRLGLPTAWLSRAEELLGPDQRRMRDLLRQVEELRDSLGEDRRQSRRLREELAAELERALAARAELEDERAEVEREARRRLAKFRERVNRDLRAEYGRLREALEAGRKRGLVGEAVERLFDEAPFERAAPAAGPIEVGATVRHLGLGWRGEVKRMDGRRVEVVVRGKRFHCRPEDLEPVEAPGGSVPTAPSLAGAGAGLDEEPPRELHLRGQRVEEALEKLDGFLDRALLAGPSEVRVVHGHGTGRLKRAVRDHLGNHPAVSGWRPGRRGEGGDGATVVTLRD